MARLDTSGIDDIIDSMVRAGEGVGELADEILLAGAEEVKEAWKESAKEHEHVDTGDMLNSINYSNKPTTSGDARQIDIYPQGRDRKGVRNAEKAFILHYGSSSIKATHWVDDADKKAAPKVEQKIVEIYDEYLKEKGLI